MNRNQPMDRGEPRETLHEREKGDPLPRGAGDNNRGYHEPRQLKGKIFQNIQEIYNNPVSPNQGAIYDEWSTVPFNINGPYHY